MAAQAAVDLVKHGVRAAVRAVALPAAGVAGQHRGVAAPVQQHQALLAARGALGQRRQQRRGDQALLGLVVQVEQAQPRQHRPGDAPWHVQPLVAPLLGGVPALQRRGGRTQDHLAARRARFELRPIHRQIARRIARPFLAFVARVVLLIDHDQAQPRQAGKNGHARAQHDARLPAMRRQPVAQPLRRGQAAVQGGHRVRTKALAKARLQLRREVDFGHQHQRLRLRVALQQSLRSAQIDLGLAAAGGPKQQHRLRALRQRGQRGGLLGAGCGAGCGGTSALLRGCVPICAHGHPEAGTAQLVQAPLQGGGVELAQLGRQRRQRHLAQRALVVARREGQQRAPGVG